MAAAMDAGDVRRQAMALRSGRSTSAAVPRLSGRQVEDFGRCVAAIFRRWTALQLAVENEWGGPASKQKAEELKDNVLEWLLEEGAKERYEDDLEDALEDSLTDDFRVNLEDGSAREVARLVFQARAACAAENAAEVERIAGRPPAEGGAAAMADAGVGRSVRQTADGRLLPKGVGAPDEDSSDDEEDDGGDSSDDDEGEGQHKRMEAPARATKPEPDEDGWTTVPVRRGRR